MDSSADVGPDGRPEPVAELLDGVEDRFQTGGCGGGAERLAVAIEVPCGVPKVPGMVGTCERCLDVVVHSRGDAVDGVGFVQFAADDVRSMECFAEKAGGIDQQCGGREGDEELFGSGAIDALGILPDFVDELEEGTSRPRIRKLELPKLRFLGRRDVTAGGHGDGIVDGESLGLEVAQRIAEIDDGEGGGFKLLTIHTV